MEQIHTRKIAAEAIGTFVFFLIGFMAIVSSKAFNNPDFPGRRTRSRTWSSSRSASAWGCSRPSSSRVTSPAVTTTRP